MYGINNDEQLLAFQILSCMTYPIGSILFTIAISTIDAWKIKGDKNTDHKIKLTLVIMSCVMLVAGYLIFFVFDFCGKPITCYSNCIWKTIWYECINGKCTIKYCNFV